MKNQIQFAIVNVYGAENAGMNAQLREQLEGPLNNGWKLNDWKVVERGLDDGNRRVITLVVCVTRELEEISADTPEPAVAAKRGRPAAVKEAEPA